MTRLDTRRSDAQLMRLVQAGHDECFETLVARYERALLRVAESRLGREASGGAADAVQETLLAAYKSRQTFDPDRNFRTWLWTILLNQCRRSAKRAGRTPRVDGWSKVACTAAERSQLEAGLADPGPSPPERLAARESRDQVDRLLAQLTPAQGDAVRLRFFGGLTFPEIAETVGCSLATAKNRVRCGLTELSQMLDDGGPR